ncbi:hypothetical protein ACEU2D_23530 [Brevibacillus laterosporus]|uniref:hypothetical protein n=1 Tax=Brevibacillus laterosporus TaxID=1465 RepID=UPI0035A6D2A4
MEQMARFIGSVYTEEIKIACIAFLSNGEQKWIFQSDTGIISGKSVLGKRVIYFPPYYTRIMALGEKPVKKMEPLSINK